ncbi:MAG: hypothetical protein VYE18_00445 [Pseudomonadota bacterium]|nr:hypothetical protein [Pseudomonadota bacterium]
MLTHLGQINFTFTALLKNLAGPGVWFCAGSWALDMAAKLSAENGSCIADNNWCYARYNTFLEIKV